MSSRCLAVVSFTFFASSIAYSMSSRVNPTWAPLSKWYSSQRSQLPAQAAPIPISSRVFASMVELLSSVLLNLSVPIPGRRYTRSSLKLQPFRRTLDGTAGLEERESRGCCVGACSLPARSLFTREDASPRMANSPEANQAHGGFENRGEIHV